MKKIIILCFFFYAVLVLCSCGSKDKNVESTSEGTVKIVDVNFASNDEEMFTDRDTNEEYDKSSSIVIELKGDSVSCSSSSVKISGTTVTITDEGTYILTGTLNNGMIKIDADDTDKPHIIFCGASVTSATSAPFYIIEADKVVVTLADETENELINGGSFEAVDENNIDGAVFSKQDLSFNGTGSLTVTSLSGHGIVCKDDLVFTGGNYTVNCASHGLDANDSIRISDSSITINSGKDGMHAENSDDTSLGFVYLSSGTLNITAEGDGISAGAYAQFEGGNVSITAGGGSKNGASHSSGNYGGFMGGGPHGPSSSSSSSTSDDSTSMKGIKAVSTLLFSDGSFTVNSADDSIHSNMSVAINGGNFELASGDDAIHADETLSVTSGKINISTSYEGFEALNVSVSGGDIRLVATDDGINAAGGMDSSGTGGRDNGSFGGGRGPGGSGGHGAPGGGGGMSGSSNGSIVVSGGNLYINSSGDGMDANGTLSITGGYTVVIGPTQGDTATLDYDISGTIRGGTFIGTGASGMAQTFSESENQGVISVSVGNQSAGTKITLADKSGNVIISHTPELSFAVVILSSPDIKKGESYTITVGSASDSFEAN